jgi:UPF0716 protein FxsA
VIWLVLIFIIVPLAELYVIIQVGGAIGIWPTLALLIADSILGVWLLRSQGRTAWARFNRALAEGRVPAAEVFDGAMVILGGAFLLTPGFITDIIGIVLLVPPTRAIVRRLSAGLAKRRMSFGWTVMGTGAGGGQRTGPGPRPGPGPSSRRPSRSYDYEGTATEVPEDPPELPGPGGRDG